ncbi:MAG: hypothetical protein QOE63_1930 [Acidimicrobiaceae bacterium]
MYQVTLSDQHRELIDEADAYQMEGQLTTFFQRGRGRDVIDCWSTRVASFRTADVVSIRRVTSASGNVDLQPRERGESDQTSTAHRQCQRPAAAFAGDDGERDEQGHRTQRVAL